MIQVLETTTCAALKLASDTAAAGRARGRAVRNLGIGLAGDVVNAFFYARTVVGHPTLARGPRFLVGRGFHLVMTQDGTLHRGRGLVLRRNVTITLHGELHLGRDVFINEGCYISVRQCVELGDEVRLGERVSIHDENHVYEPLTNSNRHAYLTRPIRVAARVWIGANSVLLGGADIGPDTVIGANSVVRGSIPGGVLAAGAPAVVKRTLIP